MTGRDPEVMSFDQKFPESGCSRPKTHVLCIFQFLQGCNSQEVALTLQEMTSHEL